MSEYTYVWIYTYLRSQNGYVSLELHQEKHRVFNIVLIMKNRFELQQYLLYEYYSSY